MSQKGHTLLLVRGCYFEVIDVASKKIKGVSVCCWQALMWGLPNVQGFFKSCHDKDQRSMLECKLCPLQELQSILLKKGHMGDYIGEYYRDARSLDYSSYENWHVLFLELRVSWLSAFSCQRKCQWKVTRWPRGR